MTVLPMFALDDLIKKESRALIVYPLTSGVQVKAFALDTEHFTRSSYLGLTCVLQISTGESDNEGRADVFIFLTHACSSIGDRDWVVDALALHDHLHLMRGLLSDPGIVKVGLMCSLKVHCTSTIALTDVLPLNSCVLTYEGGSWSFKRRHVATARLPSVPSQYL